MKDHRHMHQPLPNPPTVIGLRSLGRQPKELKQSVTTLTTTIAPNAKKREVVDTTLAPNEQITGVAKCHEKHISYLIEFLEAVRGYKGDAPK